MRSRALPEIRNLINVRRPPPRHTKPPTYMASFRYNF